MVIRSEQDVRQLRYGSPEPLAERRRLQAGPLTAILEEGGLRYIRYRGQEIVRGIYAAVRDQNWGTIKPVFREQQVTRRGDSFEVAFVAEHRQGEIEFEWKGLIVGGADGTITFSFDGIAGSSFLRNRIGFCVLHPSALAGCPVEVESAGGGLAAGAFPERISPHQPFLDMTAIRHHVTDGVSAELRFAGDLFEMEDQRNWTDASFKTYCTPLRLPFPVEMKQGERVQQQITLRLIADGESLVDGSLRGFASLADDMAEAVTVELGEKVVGRMPQLGLSATPGHLHSEREIEELRRLKLSHVRAVLKLTEQEWESALACAADAASRLGACLELEVVVSSDAALGQGQLEALAAAIESCGALVDTVFIYDESSIVSSGELLVKLGLVRDAAGLEFRIGGGTRAYFAELNRAPQLLVPQLEAVMYTINPQVHAFDTASIAETVSAQGDTVRSARKLSPGLPLSIGPITFKPRMNPVALSVESKRRAEERANHVDARQWSLFGAGWTLGSLRHLAEAGADRACYYETVGPLGVMREGAASVYPLFHVFASAGDLQGAELLECCVSEPLTCEAAALRRRDAQVALLLANYTNEAVTLQVKLGGGGLLPSRLRVLDERSFSAADGSSLRLEERPLPAHSVVAADMLELMLKPFALAIMD
ncbi:hypothetical protein [Paenibacillus albus]|uniref:Uncharacterized protein n=1 Tax=Paenibacillus albus TaxID=2495582 RepID=A0A3Q8X8B4_9BACL|nr:hypothetical protein [Paenibacillus albus]AZN42763.1 hypothetical protein EJC50_26035 [Paenibacillus albus]